MRCSSDVLKKTSPLDVFGDVSEKVKHLTNDASKGTRQKRFSGFCPLREGGGYPPIPLRVFGQDDFPLRGGEVPPNFVKEKFR